MAGRKEKNGTAEAKPQRASRSSASQGTDHRKGGPAKAHEEHKEDHLRQKAWGKRKPARPSRKTRPLTRNTGQTGRAAPTHKRALLEATLRSSKLHQVRPRQRNSWNLRGPAPKHGDRWWAQQQPEAHRRPKGRTAGMKSTRRAREDQGRWQAGQKGASTREPPPRRWHHT